MKKKKKSKDPKKDPGKDSEDRRPKQYLVPSPVTNLGDAIKKALGGNI